MAATSFYLATLGCKVNQYESQSLREAWTARGLVETASPDQADVILINTCAVTARAVADVRGMVRRLHRAAPAAALILTGCAAEVLEQELAALPGVQAVVPQRRKEELLHQPAPVILHQPALEPGHPAPEPSRPASEARQPVPESRPSALVPEPRRPAPEARQPAPADTAGETPAAPSAPYPAFAVSGFERTRAVLKIQDGCSHRCTYCIVPLARGGTRSRPFTEALAEARRLLAAGFRELVISGVNLRQYRMPDAPPALSGSLSRPLHDKKATAGFWSFLSHLDAALAPEWEGRARLRISSLEPGQLAEPEALAVLGSCRLCAPHLHLSLQSGSPAVLRRMGRGHYDPASSLLPFLERFSAVHPFFGLGADILTAFPGETEQEFHETLDLLRALPVSYAHVFPYSSRPGTVAAGLSGHLPAQVKKERAARIRALIAEKKRAFLHRLLALPQVSVAFEDRAESGGGLRGVNEYYVDCKLLRAPGAVQAAQSGADRVVCGELTAVRPCGVEGEELLVVLPGAGDSA